MQSNHSLKQNTSWLQDSLFLFIILGGLLLLFLGFRPLFVPDEGRYAEIAREMAASNQYITPYLDYVKYFEKPPLFYWLSAIAIKTFGIHVSILRCINALLALSGCLFTYFTGRKLFNRDIGFSAALILGTSTLYFAMAHMINLDMTVSVFLMATFYCFLLAINTKIDRNRKWLMWSSALFAGLSVLTKGLIGIVFPALIVGTWLLMMREWRWLKKLYLPSSFLIFFLVVAPWHILVSLYNKEFFYFYFIEQHILRYITTTVGHYKPYWYFIPCLILGFFPWIVFLPQTIYFHARQLKRKQPENTYLVFLLCWAIIIFAFFSFSKSKLISYILPLFPPLALLTARYLHDHLTPVSKGIKIASLALIFIAMIVVGVFVTFVFTTELPDQLHAKIYLCSGSILLLIGSSLTAGLAFKNNRYLFKTLVATAWLFLLSGLLAAPYIDTRTIQPLAKQLRPLLKPTDQVVTYGQYYQDLPFYLKRRVLIVGWQNELEFGMQHQNTSSWMLSDYGFWLKWHSPTHLYVFMSADEYHKMVKNFYNLRFFVIAHTKTNYVVSNFPY